MENKKNIVLFRSMLFIKDCDTCSLSLPHTHSSTQTNYLEYHRRSFFFTEIKFILRSMRPMINQFQI